MYILICVRWIFEKVPTSTLYAPYVGLRLDLRVHFDLYEPDSPIKYI